LFLALDHAVAGKRIGDIGSAVQEHVEPFGYSVVRELVGHGIGKKLHEKPDVPNYGKQGTGIKTAGRIGHLHRAHDQYGSKNIPAGKRRAGRSAQLTATRRHILKLTVVVKKEEPDYPFNIPVR